MSFGFVYCGKDDGRQGSGSRCRVVDCESFLSSFTNNGTGGICGQEDRPGCYGADAGGGIYEIGIGKTTLLKSILGLIPSISGECELGEKLQLGYFEQEVSPDNRNSCIEEIWEEFPSFSQYEVRSALAKCGLTTKHIESQVRVLSGGEQAKVRLCKLINRDTNILLLDEPTNHLDVDAKDSLKKALQEYRGSILLICHEPEFYQDVVNEVWDMSKWTTKVF